ncbi:MAG TPA: cytochrome bc complex cytochrome b subunit [Candidatus Binatia bacterium]|nr:cytochrome bc complex cytochrome b subunit [Candidatus Binatia bacterium]
MALAGWLDDRLRLPQLRAFLGHKRVPTHHAVWYYLGGVTLFLYGIQVATGILLLLYYRPTPDAAYESVRFIVAHVPFGWLVRSVHAWAANLMIATAFAHAASVFFLQAYRPPRELTWVSGVVLLGLVLAFGFSGYLLPWNELAFFATKVGTDITGSVPVLGRPLLVVLRGGEDVTGATLTRFFGVHVALLPFVTTAVLLGHLALVQVHGMSEPLGDDPRTTRHIPFAPHFMLREALVWLGVLAVLVTLATFLPWELGRKADPFAPAPVGIRPEWYFTFMSQSLKYLPPTILGFEGERVGILVFGLVFLAFFALPFLDRRAARGQRSRALRAAGVAFLAFMAAMTLLAYLKPY